MIYGAYTEVNYNNTVVDGRWFCGATGLTGPFSGVTCDPSFRYWSIGTHHDWYPLQGLRFAIDVLYTNIESAMNGQTVNLTTQVGARPTGVYTVKDQSITSVVFRAQRTWGGD